MHETLVTNAKDWTTISALFFIYWTVFLALLIAASLAPFSYLYCIGALLTYDIHAFLILTIHMKAEGWKLYIEKTHDFVLNMITKALVIAGSFDFVLIGIPLYISVLGACLSHLNCKK